MSSSEEEMAAPLKGSGSKLSAQMGALLDEEGNVQERDSDQSEYVPGSSDSEGLDMDLDIDVVGIEQPPKKLDRVTVVPRLLPQTPDLNSRLRPREKPQELWSYKFPRPKHARKSEPLQYECPLCHHTFTHRRDSLFRHFRLIHKMDKRDPEYQYYAREMPGRRSEFCPGCNRVYGNLGQHLSRCKKIKKAQKKAEERHRRLNERTGSRRIDPTATVRDFEGLIDRYKSYLGVRGLVPRTIRQYSSSLRCFLHYCMSHSPGFKPWLLFTEEWRKQELTLLPVGLLAEYGRTLKANPALTLAKAVERFAGMLNQHALLMVNRMPTELQDRLCRNVQQVSTAVSELRATCRRQSSQLYRENRASKEQRKDLSTRPHCCRNLIRRFVGSPWFENVSNELVNNPKSVMKSLSPTDIRNLVLVTVLLSSGGHRGGALLNITLGEYQAAVNDEPSTSSGKRTELVIKVARHKTATTYGPLSVCMANSKFIAMVESYVWNFRPQLMEAKMVSKDELPLFPSSRAHEVDFVSNSGNDAEAYQLTQIRDVVNWMRCKLVTHCGATDPFDPQLKTLTSGAIRKAFAEFGRNSQDEVLRDEMAKYMGHSQSTRDKYYIFDQDSRAVRHIAQAVNEHILLGDMEEEEEEYSSDLEDEFWSDVDMPEQPVQEECKGKGKGKGKSSKVPSAPPAANPESSAPEVIPQAGEPEPSRRVTKSEQGMLLRHFRVKGLDNQYYISVTDELVTRAKRIDESFRAYYDRILEQSEGIPKRAKDRIRSSVKRSFKE